MQNHARPDPASKDRCVFLFIYECCVWVQHNLSLGKRRSEAEWVLRLLSKQSVNTNEHIPKIETWSYRFRGWANVWCPLMFFVSPQKHSEKTLVFECSRAVWRYSLFCSIFLSLLIYFTLYGFLFREPYYHHHHPWQTSGRSFGTVVWPSSRWCVSPSLRFSGWQGLLLYGAELDTLVEKLVCVCVFVSLFHDVRLECHTVSTFPYSCSISFGGSTTTQREIPFGAASGRVGRSHVFTFTIAAWVCHKNEIKHQLSSSERSVGNVRVAVAWRV